MIKEIKENNIYDFRYNAEYVENHFEPYHCFEGQLIVLKNRKDELVLVDTFWGFGFDQYNDVFTLEEAQQKGKLSFICNLDEVEKCEKWELKYYDDKDTFCLTEQSGCRRYYYKRKDAKKSVKKIKKMIKRKIEKSERKIKYAKSSIKSSKEKLKKIESGEDINNIYI